LYNVNNTELDDRYCIYWN